MESLAFVLIRNDRRLLDHEALTRAKDFDRYIIVTTLPPQWNLPDRMSDKRKEFVMSSLNAFAKKGPVHFAERPHELIEKLKSKFELSVLVEEQGAEEEEQELAKIKDTIIIRVRPNTIFYKPKLYPTFTPFKNHSKNPEPYLSESELDPKRSVIVDEYLFRPFPVAESVWTGEENALKRAELYFSNYLETYNDTRNYLEDAQGSSKFSYFLANGELSVRYLYAEIEKRSPDNWLGVELLWREFFWQHGVNFTLPSKGKKIPDWESHITHPLARAIYNELVSTGYLSNRSRQILASYLIYEIGLDWKIGASFYEKHLLDYDVFVNWGNWQYIAGVKFDPRGGRKFNLDLQVEKYDPDGIYQKKWSKI